MNFRRHVWQKCFEMGVLIDDENPQWLDFWFPSRHQHGSARYVGDRQWEGKIVCDGKVWTVRGRKAMVCDWVVESLLHGPGPARIAKGHALDCQVTPALP